MFEILFGKQLCFTNLNLLEKSIDAIYICGLLGFVVCGTSPEKCQCVNENVRPMFFC